MKAIFPAALLLGLSFDLLVRDQPGGVNVPIWTLLALGAAYYVTRQPRAMLFGSIGALVAAGGIVWRVSPQLVLIDVLLLLLFLGFLSLRARGVREWAAGTAEAGAALVYSGVLAVVGLFTIVFVDRPWRRGERSTGTRRVLVVLRGLAMAFPLLLLFSILLASADVAFASIFSIDIPDAFSHVTVTLIIAIPAAGYLVALSRPRDLPHIPRPAVLYLDAAETNVAIGLIDALFAAFVLVQFRYFFGGAALVKVAPGMTYAQYARRGFFELVIVAAIVVPLLLVSEWVIDKSRGLRTFRILAAVQIACVFVMLVSAYRRMQLYVDEFGLTELRVYTTAFMFLLGALLAWFAATVLTGHRGQFFLGAVISGLAVVVALHAVNPDALIVRTNLARAAAGKRTLDVNYLTSLSADAAEPLAAAHLPCRVKRGDWRSWNVSRAKAEKICR